MADDIDIDRLPKLEDEDSVQGYSMSGMSDVVNIRIGALEGLGISTNTIGKLQQAGVLRPHNPMGKFE